MQKNIIQVSYLGGTASEFEKVAELIIELKIPTKLNHIKSEDKLTEAIRRDHEDLEAGNKDLYYQEEQPAETELNSKAKKSDVTRKSYLDNNRRSNR